MKRSRKIMLGVLDILLVAISSAIGFGLIAGGGYGGTVRFGAGALFMTASTFTIITVIQMLRREE